jgi:hypothetical protein
MPARFRLTVTDRADEWSADNGGLLMPIQCIRCDTPEAVLDGEHVDAHVTQTDRADEWSPDNPALLMPTQSVTDTPGAALDAEDPDA